MNLKIVDAHAHCGRQDRYPPQAYEDYLHHVSGSGISGAVMFAPVIEIYDRYDPEFVDSVDWQARRQAANDYLLAIGNEQFKVLPFFFIWNDFAYEQLTDQHKGIKWHRHSDEPRYRYDDPRCREALEEISRRNLPVCLEEEWRNTMLFIDELAPEVNVIIPHCGFLNGGYNRLCNAGIWKRPNIYTDTSLAPSEVVSHYIKNYGYERIMFGSDFPFGDPVNELQKILRLNLSEEVKRAVLGANIERLTPATHPESG